MAPAQATHFASTYTVLEQFPGTAGLSVTLFQEVATGKKHVAIRGTQDASDIWTDIADIAILGTPERQAQYASLKAKLNEWLVDPTKLQGQPFSVAGHSLGGFLAGALLVDFPGQIEHAYLYNAPGVGGLSASLRLLLGLETSPTLDLARVSNIRADAGASPIAGLGLAWGTPIPIAIENQLASDVSDPPAARNHSQQILTDALAIYAAYAGLSPSLDIEQIGDLFKQSAGTNALALESALDALRITLLDGSIATDPARQTRTGDREVLYTNLYALQDSAGYKALADTAAIKSMSALSAAAAADLTKTLIAFAMQAYYDGPKAAEIDHRLFETVSGGVHFDRSDIAVNLGNIKGYTQYFQTFLATLPAAEQSLINQYLPNLLDWYLTGTRLSATAGNKSAFMLGAGDADRLTGGSQADLLIGLGGTDLLDGGAGDDVLAGGEGRDIYRLVEQGGKDRIEDDDGILMWGSQIVAGVFRQEGTSQTYRHAQDANIMLDFGGGAATLKFADGTQAILTKQTTPGDFDGTPFGSSISFSVGGAQPRFIPAGGGDTIIASFMKVSLGRTANDSAWRAGA